MEPSSAIWILLIGATILLAAIVDSASHHARLPSMVGYIAIGWLLLQLDARWALLGEHGRAAFSLLGDIGLVVLLFHVGLRSNMQRLLAKLRPAAWIWIGNVALSGITGYLAARVGAGLPVAAALVVAIALTATSIGVATAAWAERDALGSPDGDLMLDVAELDDLSAVLLMAVVISVVPHLGEPGPLTHVLLGAATAFASKLLAFAAICWAFARYAERPLTEFAASRRRAPQRMLIVVGAGLVIAAIAGALGFSLAIGALFAGLIFSRDPEAVRAESRLDDLHDFFVPFFFVTIGLAAEIRAGDGAIGLGALLLGVGIFSKVVGTALPALRATSPRGALLLGVSMIPRAEIALVIAYQGITLGVLSESTYAAIVFVSASSCMLAPWLIAALLRERPGA